MVEVVAGSFHAVLFLVFFAESLEEFAFEPELLLVFLV